MDHIIKGGGALRAGEGASLFIYELMPLKNSIEPGLLFAKYPIYASKYNVMP